MFDLTATVPGRLDAALRVAPGETVAILGENGAGKSTMLAAIAGLVRPHHGSASLDGRTLFGPGTWVPPHRRGISLLAQDPLLFPHLSVLDNVAFGPRSAGRSAADSRVVAQDWLQRVDADALAARRPDELSGGQAQRVAVARALASDPRLLLLDEPMAALDVTVVPALRSLLRTVLAERSVVIVTHDVIDAYTLADRVVVLEAGRVAHEGATRQVLAHPRTPFAAALVGLTLLVGQSTSRGIRIEGMDVVASAPIAPGMRAAATLSPAHVSLSREHRPGGNVVEATVTAVETLGNVVRVHAGPLAADVLPSALDALPGDRVWLSFPPDAVTVYAL